MSDTTSRRNTWDKEKEGASHHIENVVPVPTTTDTSTSSNNQWERNDKANAPRELENRPYEYDHVTQFPNAWSRYRAKFREPVAEFLGTCILVIFGNGVNCQVVLSNNVNVVPTPSGSYLSICFGWAAGIALGAWVSAGISGGHINPAVTLALAVYRRFPWRKVPIYMISQLFGGIMGAAFVYWQYFHAINIVEGGNGVRTLATAGLFATYAQPYMSSVSCFFSEFFATALLVIVVFMMTDKRNCPPPNGLAPLVLFIALLGISAAFGLQTAFAINPARDFGPRLLTSMVGYGKSVYTYRNQYWIWCPIMAPFLGGLAGAGFYDLFLYTGDESIFNIPSAAARRNRMQPPHEQPRDIPSAVDAV